MRIDERRRDDEAVRVDHAVRVRVEVGPERSNYAVVDADVDRRVDSLCGIASRFDIAAPAACSAVTDIDTLSSAYTADTDLTDIDDYATYIGNARRVITVPIVDSLIAAGPMTVLGFRQFLVDPNQGDVNISVSDTNGRFVVLYIGSLVPLKQGRFDGGCALTSGPGKVVLHR